jgi:two-component system, NarL family, nitrate/nitrite response regulator NarL
MTAVLVDRVEHVQQASVLIIEDHLLLADGLAVALRREGLEVEIADPVAPDPIMELAWRLRPDVVLLDLVLGDEYGLSIPLIEPLRATGAQVLMLTGATDPALLGTCVEAGAVGLISKSEGFEVVLDKLSRAARHQTTLHASERERVLSSLRVWRAEERARLAPFERLTARERVVLGALMDGASAEAIAKSSFVSLATVRSQIRSILEKLSVHSQVAAVALAHRLRWEPC